MSTPAKLRKESDTLHRLYQRNFAGLPRITRDTALLREIQERAKAQLGRAPLGVRELRETIQARITLYRRELGAIEKDQAQGPFAAAAARTAGDANAIFDRYRRHFAGKARWSRDTALLDEMLDELGEVLSNFKIIRENWQEGLVASDIELVTNTIETYTNELREIEASRAGLDEEQMVGMTASSANELFGIYDRQFAGLPRLSRRPALAERLVKSLRRVEGLMATAIAVGNKDESLAQNVGIVRGRLSAWEQEHQEILAARASAEVSQLVEALVDELDAAWKMWEQDFAGKLRDTSDAVALSGLVDRVDEVVRQARDLHRTYDLESTDKLLRQSRDMRLLLMRGHNELQQLLAKRSVH